MDNNMNMGSAWYKKGWVWLVVVVVLVVLGFVLFGGNKEEEIGGALEAGQTEQSATDPRDGETAVFGKLACTPLKSGAEPTPDQCVLGLAGSDGKFYALDTSKLEIAGKGITPESELKVVGKLSSVDADSEEAGVFSYDGVMAARLMVIKN